MTFLRLIDHRQAILLSKPSQMNCDALLAVCGFVLLTALSAHGD